MILHPKQLELLQAIEAEGRGVTHRGLAARLGVASHGSIRHRLKRLHRRGLVSWEHQRIGTLRVTTAGLVALRNGGLVFAFHAVKTCPACGVSTALPECPAHPEPKTLAEVARALGLSVRTVKRAQRSGLEKYGRRLRAAALH